MVHNGSFVPQENTTNVGKNLLPLNLQEAEDKEMASHLGAEICGGADLVKAFTKGDIKHDDYDHCICMADMYDDISTLRKYVTR